MALESENSFEINAIRYFISTYNVTIQRIHVQAVHPAFCPLELVFDNKSMVVLVNDEYQDLKYNNVLLNFVLVYREFELLEESNDFLDWCKAQSVSPNSNNLLSYYINAIKQMPEVKKCFVNKKITSFVSALDFQLNSGVMQILRQ